MLNHIYQSNCAPECFEAMRNQICYGCSALVAQLKYFQCMWLQISRQRAWGWNVRLGDLLMHILVVVCEHSLERVNSTTRTNRYARYVPPSLSCNGLMILVIMFGCSFTWFFCRAFRALENDNYMFKVAMQASWHFSSSTSRDHHDRGAAGRTSDLQTLWFWWNIGKHVANRGRWVEAERDEKTLFLQPSLEARLSGCVCILCTQVRG